MRRILARGSDQEIVDLLDLATYSLRKPTLLDELERILLARRSTSVRLAALRRLAASGALRGRRDLGRVGLGLFEDERASIDERMDAVRLVATGVLGEVWTDDCLIDLPRFQAAVAE